MTSLVEPVDLGCGVRAGFTTRAGGVSGPPWASLNLAVHVGDDPAAVAANRARVDAWLGVPVAYATQVHGATVLRVTGAPRGTEPVGEADALVTTESTVGLGVLVADCVPVLLADPVAGVVAVAHAGRAGLVAGVVPAVLAVMRDVGAVASQVVAAVGPSIAGRSYEVPADLRDAVEAVLPGTATRTSWGSPAVDVAAGVLRLLADLGVARVTRTPADTFTDRRWYSYRRDGRTTGRFAGVLRLLP